MAGKVVFVFTLGQQGWSESYFNLASDLDTLFGRGFNLARERSRLVGLGASLDYIRCSVEGQPRIATLHAVGQGTQYPLPIGAYTSQADKVNTSVLLQAFSTVGSCQRKITLRGNPDLVYDRESAFANPDALLYDGYLVNNLYPAFVDASNQWTIKRRERPNTALTRYNVTAVANVAGTLNSTWTLDAPYAGAVGDLLQSYAFKGAIPAPGIVRVVNVPSASEVTVRYSFAGDYRYPLGAYAVPAAFTYQQISQVQFERFSSHKTGRPFGVPRGRAPARPR